MEGMQPQKGTRRNYCTIMEYYEEYFDIMKGIFKNENIPSSYYGFFEYIEDAVCINLIEYNEWHICNMEKGNKYREQIFNTIVEVCYEMLSRVSDDVEQEISMKTLFDKQVIENNLLLNHISFLTTEIKRKQHCVISGDSPRRDIKEMSIQRRLLCECLRKCGANYYNKEKSFGGEVLIERAGIKTKIEIERLNNDEIRIEINKETLKQIDEKLLHRQLVSALRDYRDSKQIDEIFSALRDYHENLGSLQKPLDSGRIVQIEEVDDKIMID